MFLVLVPFWVAMGLVAAGLARRYGRNPVDWGFAGAVLPVIVLPLLFYLGERGPQVRREPTRKLAAEVEARPAAAAVLRALCERSSDWDELQDRAGVDDDALGDELDWMWDTGMVDVDDGEWQVTPRGEIVLTLADEGPEALGL